MPPLLTQIVPSISQLLPLNCAKHAHTPNGLPFIVPKSGADHYRVRVPTMNRPCEISNVYIGKRGYEASKSRARVANVDGKMPPVIA